MHSIWYPLRLPAGRAKYFGASILVGMPHNVYRTLNTTIFAAHVTFQVDSDRLSWWFRGCLNFGHRGELLPKRRELNIENVVKPCNPGNSKKFTRMIQSCFSINNLHFFLFPRFVDNWFWSTVTCMMIMMLVDSQETQNHRANLSKIPSEKRSTGETMGLVELLFRVSQSWSCSILRTMGLKWKMIARSK